MADKTKLTFLGRELALNDIDTIKSPVLRETLKQFSQKQDDSIKNTCIVAFK